MFDLTFLGTSASVPSAERNHPGLLVEAGGHRIMVDCGEGTQRQLLRSGAGFRRLNRLLLTHAKHCEWTQGNWRGFVGARISGRYCDCRTTCVSRYSYKLETSCGGGSTHDGCSEKSN